MWQRCFPEKQDYKTVEYSNLELNKHLNEKGKQRSAGYVFSKNNLLLFLGNFLSLHCTIKCYFPSLKTLL